MAETGRGIIQERKYYWENGDADDVKVVVPIAETIKSKDIDYKLTRKTLKVGIKGQEPIIDDALFKDCDDEESSWEIANEKGQRCFVLQLMKKKPSERWACLLKCEEVGVEQCTLEDHRALRELAAMTKEMSKFTTAVVCPPVEGGQWVKDWIHDASDELRFALAPLKDKVPQEPPGCESAPGFVHVFEHSIWMQSLRDADAYLCITLYEEPDEGNVNYMREVYGFDISWEKHCELMQLAPDVYDFPMVLSPVESQLGNVHARPVEVCASLTQAWNACAKKFVRCKVEM